MALRGDTPVLKHSVIVTVDVFPPVVKGQSPADASNRNVSLPSVALSEMVLNVKYCLAPPSANGEKTSSHVAAT